MEGRICMGHASDKQRHISQRRRLNQETANGYCRQATGTEKDGLFIISKRVKPHRAYTFRADIMFQKPEHCVEAGKCRQKAEPGHCRPVGA